ncbi:hypothetical protein Tco_0773641 [Tanacetum coccineum]|uniref:Uncharacterized protein n=1 Tax=Tanacetum coccineum TaxID=301880 RepID=A0ABQ4ZLE6_9ASTR
MFSQSYRERLQPYTFGTCPVHCITQKACDDRQISVKGRLNGQPTEDEGAVLESPYETQPTPSPTHPSEDQSEPQPDPFLRPSSSNPIPDSILEGSGRNHGGQPSSDRSLSGNENGLTLQSVYDLYGRKPAKSEPTVHKDLAFDDLDDAMDYMETEDAHDEGIVKDSKETRVSTEDQVSTDKPNKCTGTIEPKDGNSYESAAPTTVFRDDETIAQFLVTMSQNKTKQKGFEIKDTDRPRTTTERSILTLKPLPNIDPKDKGKKVLEEKAKSDAESEVEEEKKKLAEEEATKAAFTNEYDFIQARLKADKILAEKLQEEEREKFTIEQRAKFLHDTIYVGGYRHAQLNKKKFEEIQVMYEKVSEEPKTTKVKAKIKEPKENIRKRSERRLKMKALKRSKSQKTDSNQEEENQLRTFLKIVPEEEEKIYYEVLGTRWRLYEACGVCILELKDGTVIYMLVERRYPLSKELLQRMLDLGLEVEEESTAALHLVRFIKQQLNEEHQELTSPEANGFCEELASPGSNSSWLSIHLVVYNEELAIPEQTATGKGISNPLMAGSLPKTTKPT